MSHTKGKDIIKRLILAGKWRFWDKHFVCRGWHHWNLWISLAGFSQPQQISDGKVTATRPLNRFQQQLPFCSTDTCHLSCLFQEQFPSTKGGPFWIPHHHFQGHYHSERSSLAVQKFLLWSNHSVPPACLLCACPCHVSPGKMTIEMM